LDGDRQRARRDERCVRARQPAPARLLARADALARAALRHRAERGDRAQREPAEPVPPRALPGLALPDARRLDARRHDRVSRATCGAGPPRGRSARARAASRRAELLTAARTGPRVRPQLGDMLDATAQAFGYVNLIAFTALGVVAIRQWRTRHDSAAGWAAAAFGSIAFVVLAGRAVPEHPELFVEKALARVDIAALVLFPYLLFRFARTFGRQYRKFDLYVASVTTLLVVWTFAIPHFPESGEPRPAQFVAYLIVFLIHFAVLLVFVAWRRWTAGAGLPSVARRRMRMLAAASTLLTLALLSVAVSSDTSSVTSVVGQVLASLSAFAFWLGLAPPRLVRVAWRRPEEERLQEAIGSLMARATTQGEGAARVIEPRTGIVGARAGVGRDAEGGAVGARGVGGESGEPVALAVPGGP